MAATSSPSPLLRGQGLPPFEAITPEQVNAAIPELLDQLNGELSQLEQELEGRLEQASSGGDPLGWAEVMDPLHHLGERLRWSWGVVSHLNGV
ncbi:MAG: M3 family peptidase, partial [Cyanobium sp.]